MKPHSMFAVHTFGRRILSLVVLVSCAMTLSSLGQVAGGTISGTLSDPSGSVLPRIQVTLTNVATGVATIVKSNEDGLYSGANLIPGVYDVSVATQGFAKQVARAVT